MSRTKSPTEIVTDGPEYVGWRGKLVAELALARLDALTVYRQPAEGAFDFLVATPGGLCFFVNVKAFSSAASKIDDVHLVEELTWDADPALLLKAHGFESPVILFLIDADTDHGRYLRIDTLPAPASRSRRHTLRFPRANAITRDGLERLISVLERSRTA